MTTGNPGLGELRADAVRAALDEAADAAAAETLPLFRSALAIDNKAASGFDPVTEADRRAEQAIRDVLARHFPDHAIFGEEGIEKFSKSDFRWVIDPIDGTRAFISGIPMWGTLIGLTWRGRAVAGSMSQPFTGETYLALPGEATYRRGGQSGTLRTSSVTDLARAKLLTTTPALFLTPALRAAYDAVEARTLQVRYGCDCYGYALVASGHADLVIEAGLNAYDIAALIPIIEEAGGVVTTWTGERADDGGDIIAAATPELHAAAMEILAANGAPRP